MADVVDKPQTRSWLILGGVLWGAVAVSLVLLWNQQKELAAKSDSLEPMHVVTLNPAGEATGEDPDDNGRVTPKLDLTPPWPKTGLPDFSLVNQRNEAVTKKDLEGQPWVASFIFTRCAGTCGRVTSQLKVLQDRLKNVPVRLVSFSVQPENDTPEVLARYADSLGANPERWHFLTGDKDEIHKLIQGGFYQYVAPSRSPTPVEGFEVDHSNNVCLVDATGRVIGKYNSLDDVAVAKLARDVERLVKTGSIDPPEKTAEPAESGKVEATTTEQP